MKSFSMLKMLVFTATLTLLLAGTPARAGIIYSNDFETDTTGFTAGGDLSNPLPLARLPTDGGGFSSPNKSRWLGPLGAGVPKSGLMDEIVTLNLSGLMPGASYDVAFDLFIGSTWDGAAAISGPDRWRFAVDGVRLVDTTFANLGAAQQYSDTDYNNHNDLSGPYVAAGTGADYSYLPGFSNPGASYAIYRFGRGAGNPMLSFTATGATAVLEFARYGDTTDSRDEYWALDNVVVQSQSVPEPSSLTLLGFGALGLIGYARRRRIVAAR